MPGTGQPPVNHIRLSDCIIEAGALRYTPAGLPALDLRLEHESQTEEAGQLRQVKAVLKAVAIGAMAERLGKQPVGARGCFAGFVATPRNARHVVLHIQDFQQDQFQGGF